MLNGYLCLRKLVVQRTKLIDETQDMLLEMLEDMTTGSTAQQPRAGGMPARRRWQASLYFEERGREALVLGAVKFQNWA